MSTQKNKISRRLCIFSYILPLIIFILPLCSGLIPSTAYAEDLRPWANNSHVTKVVDKRGRELLRIIVPGRPPEKKAAAASLPQVFKAGSSNSLNPDTVPAFEWAYGCSPTAAAMIFGYYDRNGYPNMYTGPTNGGVCPLDNSVWGPGIGGSNGECPISASHNGKDGRITRGHVDDYWIAVDSAGPDPYITNSWTEHTADSAGDFMGTSRWSDYEHTDGTTNFYYYSNGDPLYDYTDCEPGDRDGCHGMKLFVQSRGYTVQTNYTQLIYGQGHNPAIGFTFANFCSEIDAGRPVLIQMTDHTMLGYGYDTTSGNVIYIHDTWDSFPHSMTWGDTYGGRQHFAVTVLRLNSSSPPVAPALSTPINGSSTGGTSVVFQWSASPGATQYRLQVNSNSFFSGTELFNAIVTATSQTVSGFTNTGSNYYWRVYAGNASEWSGPSEIWTFFNTAPQKLLGVDDVAPAGPASGGCLTMGKFTAASTGTMSEIRVKCTTAGSVKVALYSDSSGSPGTLLNANDTGASVVVGWNTISIPSTSVIAGTNYWIAFNSSSACVGYAPYSGGAILFRGYAYSSSFPGSAGTGFMTASNYHCLTAGWGTGSASPQKLLGVDDVTPAGSASAGCLTMDKFTAASAGTLSEIRVKCTTAGSVKVALYSDNSGSPGTLLNANDTGTSVVVGWNTINIPSTSVTAGINYWIAFNSSSACVGYAPYSGGAILFRGYAYSSSFPGSAGTGFMTAASYHCLTAGWDTGVVGVSTPPAVTTNAATSITVTGATLNGNLTALGTATTVNVSFKYSTTSGGPYLNLTTPVAMSGTALFNASISGLVGSTTYYYQAVADGGANGISSGDQQMFTTMALSTPPAVTTNAATSITSTGAILNGNLTALGTATTVNVSFKYGTTSGGPYPNSTTPVAKSAVILFNAPVSGLAASTTYYYQAVADGGTNGVSTGVEVAFTSGASAAPQKLLGVDDVAPAGPASGGCLTMGKFTAASTGTMSEIRVKCTTAGSIKVALYSDSSGSPGTLLNANDTGTSVVAGWNTISIPSTSVIAGINYWIAFNSSSACVGYAPYGGDAILFRGYAYSSSFPGSAGTGFMTASNYHCLTAGWGTGSASPQKLLGVDDVTPAGPASAGCLTMDKFTAASAGTLSEIRVKCTTAGSVKVALYSDNSGSPGTLLNANDTGTSVVVGWNTINIPSTSVTAGINYWIAFNSSSACVGYAPYSGGAILFRGYAYSSSFPGSAGTGFMTAASYHCLTAGWGSQ